MSSPSSAVSPASSGHSPQALAPSPEVDLWNTWRKAAIARQLQRQCERDANRLSLKNEHDESSADYLHSRPVIVKLVRYGFSSAQFLLTSVYDVFRSRVADNDSATILFSFVTLCSVGSFLSSSVASPWLEAKSWEKSHQSLQHSMTIIEQQLYALSPKNIYPFTLSTLHEESLLQRLAAIKAISKPALDEDLLTRNLLTTIGFTLIGFILTLSGKLIPDETVSTLAPIFNFLAAMSFLVGDRLQLLRLKRKQLQAREDLLYTLQAQLSPLPQVADEEKQAPAGSFAATMQLRNREEEVIQGNFSACFKRLLQENREAYALELRRLIRQLPRREQEMEEKSAEQQPVTDEIIMQLEAKLETRRQDEAYNRVAKGFSTAQDEYKEKASSIWAGTKIELKIFEDGLKESMRLQFEVMTQYEAEIRKRINLHRKEEREGRAIEHALTQQPRFLPR